MSHLNLAPEKSPVAEAVFVSSPTVLPPVVGQGAPRRAVAAWTMLIGLLVIGYITQGRSFAYVGIPQLKIFIGEVVLCAFLFLQPRGGWGRWLAGLTTYSPLSYFAWALYLFLAYGVFELLRGLLIGYDAVTALQNLVFNVYPLYFFLGLFVGERRPDFLPRLLWFTGWANGVYGTMYVLFLSRLMHVQGAWDEGTVQVVGQPSGSMLSLLAVVTFWPHYARRRGQAVIVVLLNLFVLLGVQVRAEWLGMFVAFAIWVVCARQFGRAVAALGVVVLLLAVSYAGDVKFPGPEGRGGEISTRGIVARIIAPLDAETASKLTPEAEAMAGTVKWRQNWWQAIWDVTHERQTTTLIGQGYGFPLGEVVTYLEGHGLRTPHNVFYYSLGYGGWVGVVIFFVFQLTIGGVHWVTFRRTSQSFGLAYWAGVVASALFGNFFETPFGAIPYYLITGLTVAQYFSGAAPAAQAGSLASPAGGLRCAQGG